MSKIVNNKWVNNNLKMNVIQNIIIKKSTKKFKKTLPVISDEFNEPPELPLSPCGICGTIHLRNECSIINAKYYVKDVPVISKARLSVPINLEIVSMSEGSCAIRALEIIKQGTRFGPFEATKMFNLDPQVVYPLKIFKTDEYFKEFYLNNSNEYECNWMIFVQPAMFLEEQNLMSYEDNSQIFYISKRQIEIGDYLKVWYSPHSARLMNENLLTSSINAQTDVIVPKVNTDMDGLIKQQQKIRNRKDWICKFCSQQYKDIVEFASHMQNHYSAQLRKSCEFCSLSFLTRGSLKKHMFIVHNNENYAKQIIGDKHANNINKTSEINLINDKTQDALLGGSLLNPVDNAMLLDDVDMHFELDRSILDSDNINISENDNFLQENDNFNFHIEESDEKFVCDICLKQFNKLISLIKHLNSHTGKYICKECNKVFARKENLLGHGCTGEINRYNCPFCKETFSLKKYVQRHIATIHKLAYKCSDICKKVFTSSKTLADHKCIPETQLLPCNICQKPFSSNRNLMRHLKLHKTTNTEQPNGNKMICEFCSNEYDTKKAFLQHKATHMKKKYSCQVCDKKFVRMATFKEHQLLHKNVLNYECDQCDKKFPLRKYLLLHLKTHKDGEFKCTICDDRFRQSTNLRIHVQRKHDKKCPDCDQNFGSLDDLRKHSVTHYDKCYECPFCKHILKLKGSLSRHLKSKHPDENIDLQTIKHFNRYKSDNEENEENVDNNNIDVYNETEFDDKDCDDIEELLNLKTDDTTMQEIEQNLDYIVSNYDANNLINNNLEVNSLQFSMDGTSNSLHTIGDDLIGDASDLIEHSFCDLTNPVKNLDEHVLDFNSLEMEFETNFSMPPPILEPVLEPIINTIEDNREVCLSMPELSDLEQNITLGENAYMLDNGNIIESINPGKVVLYVLDEQGNKAN